MKRTLSKSEEVLKRQMNLFQFIKGWKGVLFLSNDSLINKMAHYSRRTLIRDLDILEQKFLISRSYKWVNGKSIRYIKVVNHDKELLGQCNYDYLESLALANPDCFKVKWRVGYEYHEGGVHKFADYCRKWHTTIGNSWYGTGVWLLKEPHQLLSSTPIKKRDFKYDKESIGADIDQPLPF